MSRPEAEFRSSVVKSLSSLLAFPVENTVDVGTPDVCCLAGWLELKIAERPKRETSVVAVEIRKAQLIWMRNWTAQGGPGWFLTKIDDIVLLHDGAWAVRYLGKVVMADLMLNALWTSDQPFSTLADGLTHAKATASTRRKR